MNIAEITPENLSMNGSVLFASLSNKHSDRQTDRQTELRFYIYIRFGSTEQTNFITETSDNNLYNTNDIAIVFFDLETGGLKVGKDILQIAMKNENLCFNVYITPTQSIDKSASSATMLTRSGRQLYLNGREVPTVQRKLAFLKIIEFLKSLNKNVILVAHNCKFDYSHFVHADKELSLIDEFSQIIIGFTDLIPLFKLKLPNRPNKYSLKVLGEELLKISMNAAHNAVFDIDVLEKLCVTYLDIKDIIKTKITIKDIIENN